MRGLLRGVVFLAALSGPILFWNGGSLELESTAFIPNYLADRPILQKVFDPHVNDFDTYQARELSYVIDLLDAEFYQFVARTVDRALFVSLSSFAASVLIVAVFFAGVRRTMVNIDALTAALLAACLLSSFQFVSTMGVYYRSSKPLLTVAVLAFLFHVRRVHRDRSRQQDGSVLALTRDGLIAGALCTSAGLLDRQGFFYVMVACVMFALHYRRTGQLGDLLTAAGVSVAVLAAYNVAIGPLLIHALNGYWPDFSNQSRSLLSVVLLWHPEYFWRALTLLLENTGELFGGVRSAALVSLVLLSAAIVWYWRAPSTTTLTYVGLVFLAQVIMFALMIHQHGPINDWVDHRYWYYPLPYLATALFAVAMWLDAVMPRLSPRQRKLVAVALFAVVLGNVASLPADKAIMTGGPWFGRVYVQSELVKSSLSAGVPDPKLDAEYRKFFDYHRGLR